MKDQPADQLIVSIVQLFLHKDALVHADAKKIDPVKEYELLNTEQICNQITKTLKFVK